jgi:hypothetical protein
MLDFTLRFLAGILLGSILFVLRFFVLPLKISVLIPFLIGLFAMIWGIDSRRLFCGYSETGRLIEGKDRC